MCFLAQILDWDYYIERLGNAIQKIITIPAALQTVLRVLFFFAKFLYLVITTQLLKWFASLQLFTINCLLALAMVIWALRSRLEAKLFISAYPTYDSSVLLEWF